MLCVAYRTISLPERKIYSLFNGRPWIGCTPFIVSNLILSNTLIAFSDFLSYRGHSVARLIWRKCAPLKLMKT